MPLLRTFPLLLAAFALIAPAVGQPPPRPSSPIEAAQNALLRGAYLEAIDRYRALAFPAQGDPDEQARDIWHQVHSFIGGTLDAAALDPEPAGPFSAAHAERYSRAQVRDAVEAIRERARSTRIVILNEAHNMPRDRAFALEVARALRPLGYSLFAAEALGNSPGRDGRLPVERLAIDRFARLDSGYYTLDPLFGDLLRQALALGYRAVSYEAVLRGPNLSPLERVVQREQGQAENLARVLRENPGARIFVYVGYSHAAEVALPTAGSEAVEWMAARLKRLTGIDPLTVDQTLVDERSARARAHRDLLAPRMRGRPSVLFLDGQPLVDRPPPGIFDLQVLHPPLTLRRGRPDWMWRIGRRPVDIPRSLLPANGRRLIQAFAANEPADAIPLDQIVVEGGRPAPPLLLPRGRIRWVIQDPVPIS